MTKKLGGIGEDQKVKLQVKTVDGWGLGFDGLLEPLREDRGVVFPYTPTIGIGHSANYGSYDTTHSIYQPNYYVNTPNPSIGITATFTANDITEARYTAAALHFFKTCTKAHFGENDTDAGSPPRSLVFNAYGHLHSKNVPVILTSVNYNLVEDIDYVEVEFNGEKTSIPTSLLVTLDLRIQMPPRYTKSNFNLKDYASGRSLKNNKGFM